MKVRLQQLSSLITGVSNYNCPETIKLIATWLATVFNACIVKLRVRVKRLKEVSFGNRLFQQHNVASSQYLMPLLVMCVQSERAYIRVLHISYLYCATTTSCIVYM